MTYPPHARLLQAFESIFSGQRYRHRDQTLGNFVASHLYEDLVALGKAPTLRDRVATQRNVLNLDRAVVGRRLRRGNGTFGELVPGTDSKAEPGFAVARGPVATVEIGVEVKILAKAMIKQIDRVVGDLRRQVEQFCSGGGNPICVGLVGVNHATQYVGYEGDRAYPTEGRAGKPHPAQEARKAEARLMSDAGSHFDEFQLLAFRASNMDPYPFEWLDFDTTLTEYSALLTRVSREYEARFA